VETGATPSLIKSTARNRSRHHPFSLAGMVEGNSRERGASEILFIRSPMTHPASLRAHQIHQPDGEPSLSCFGGTAPLWHVVQSVMDHARAATRGKLRTRWRASAASKVRTEMIRRQPTCPASDVCGSSHFTFKPSSESDDENAIERLIGSPFIQTGVSGIAGCVVGQQLPRQCDSDK